VDRQQRHQPGQGAACGINDAGMLDPVYYSPALSARMRAIGPSADLQRRIPRRGVQIREALAAVRAKTAYLDGELCGVGDDGLPPLIAVSNAFAASIAALQLLTLLLTALTKAAVTGHTFGFW
jgi:hypothetical protein